MMLPQKSPEIRVEPQNWRMRILPNGISSVGALSYEGAVKPARLSTLSNRRNSKKVDAKVAEVVFQQTHVSLRQHLKRQGKSKYSYRECAEFVRYMHHLTGYLPPKAQSRGFKGITRYGRDMVVNAAYLMQQRHGRRNLVMGLGTIPNDYSEAGKDAIHSKWPAVMNKAKQAIRYWLRTHLEPDELVGVYEIQEKRFARYGEPVLHFHFLMPLHGEESDREEFNSWWRNYWTKLLNKVAEEETAYLAVGEAEWVHTDASAYIGKYLSKGVTVVQEMCEKGFRAWVPPTWWFMTRAIRQQIKEATIEIFDVPRECVERLKDVALGKPLEGRIEWAAGHMDYIRHKGYSIMRSVRFAATGEFMNKVALMEWVSSFRPQVSLGEAILGWLRTPAEPSYP